MSQFSIRILLHNATQTQYTRLHEQMLRTGFSHFIQAKDGLRYELSPAEYQYEGNTTTEAVWSLARQVASSTGCVAAVTVRRCEETWFSGLRPVNPDQHPFA